MLVSLKVDGEKRKFIPIREIAEELNLSFHFLTKILQVLTEAKIMDSFKGPSGGIGLARKPADIRLIDIIIAIDGDQMFGECILGLPACGEQAPCSLHSRWLRQRNNLQKMFEKSNLDTLTRDLKTSKFRN